jgi:uncharacterized protein YjbJ (UPF0337 family)
MAMNWNQIKGDWKQFRGNVKRKWGKQTDNELATIAGQREQTIGFLQEMYGYDKEQAEQELYEFTHGQKPFAAIVEMRPPR